MSEDSKGSFESTFSSNVISGGMIVIQLSMCSYCLHLYLQAPSHVQHTRRMYLTVSWTIFILDLTYRTGLMWAEYDLIVNMAGSSEPAEWFLWIPLSAGILGVVLGDALLVYRCFIVWTGRRLIVVIPAMLWFGFAALSLAIIIQPLNGGGQLTISYLILGAAVNFSVTILIVWKMWTMHLRQRALADQWDTKVYFRVASLVAESAIPLALCNIGYGACLALPTHHICGSVAVPLWDIMTVLSPQLIIWRVSLQRSFTQESEISHVMSALEFERHNDTEISHHSDPDEDILLVDR